MDPLSFAAIFVVCAYSSWCVHRVTRAAEQERTQAAQERAEIMTRIQAPERIILPQTDGPAPLHVVPDDEGEMAKVGMVFTGGGDDDAA